VATDNSHTDVPAGTNVVSSAAVTTPSNPPAAVPEPPGMSNSVKPSAVSATSRRTSRGRTASNPAEPAASFRSSRLSGGHDTISEA
jgi:hypothetical protein